MDEFFHSATLVYDEADEYRPQPEPAPEPLHWCDGSVRIGIHTSIAGDMARALESAQKLGCNALQIFSGSPRMWRTSGAQINEQQAERFRARRAELRLGPLVIHANYLINLASADPVMRARSMQAFHGELVSAAALGADFLVVHPGSAGAGSPAQALAAVAQGLSQAARGVRFHKKGRQAFEFHDLAGGGLRILLENTAGMGAAVGSRFEELREIMKQAPELPLGICLDTAHAFQAGYAIHTSAGLDETIDALESTVSLRRLAVVHVNDSKTAFASRVDRHEHIGRGKIGRDAFQRILTHPRLSAAVSGGLPGRGFILETPIDAPGDDRRNVRALWNLAGIPVKQAPRAANGFSMLRAVPKPTARARGAAIAVSGRAAKIAARPQKTVKGKRKG